MRPYRHQSANPGGNIHGYVRVKFLLFLFSMWKDRMNTAREESGGAILQEHPNFLCIFEVNFQFRWLYLVIKVFMSLGVMKTPWTVNGKNE